MYWYKFNLRHDRGAGRIYIPVDYTKGELPWKPSSMRIWHFFVLFSPSTLVWGEGPFYLVAFSFLFQWIGNVLFDGFFKSSCSVVDTLESVTPPVGGRFVSIER